MEDLKKPTYTVQVGSFANYEKAKARAAEINEGWVKSVKVNWKKVYRVFVGKFDNVEMASTKRSELAKLGVDGFVKQIEN